MRAWLAGRPVDEPDLLDGIGPGLAASEGGGPLPADVWADFALRLGIRVLDRWTAVGGSEHAFDTLKMGLAAVGAARDLRSDPDGYVQVLVIQANLGPIQFLAGGSGPAQAAVALLQRIFEWGTRRVRRDRRCPWALADLAREAVDVHGAIAEQLGEDADQARSRERQAQIADVSALLEGIALR